jgi:hypothetical protein
LLKKVVGVFVVFVRRFICATITTERHIDGLRQGFLCGANQRIDRLVRAPGQSTTGCQWPALVRQPGTTTMEMGSLHGATEVCVAPTSNSNSIFLFTNSSGE